jgi:hypothetical protein
MTNAGKLYGRGIAFPPRVTADGSLAWSEGEDNVRESIRIILMTEQRERLRLPQFGGGLRRYLFEPNTVATRRQIEERITRALTVWEPRVRLESVAVEEDAADPESATAAIRYRLVATGAQQSLQLSLKLAG